MSANERFNPCLSFNPKFRRVLWITAVFLLSACGSPQEDDVASSGASETMIKWILLEACADNGQCSAAVDKQLKSCLQKSDYKKFMDATSEEEEDRYLDKTLEQVAQCILDESGKPYFKFGTQ
jgi:hypothetical protein